MTAAAEAAAADNRVRVHVVVDWRRQRVYDATCNINEAVEWVRELSVKYGNPPGELVASMTVALVDPDGQNIPLNDH